MAELLPNFSRWMCPNERTSCSAIAASASQVLHRLLVRTQRIGKTCQRQPSIAYSGADPKQCHSLKTSPPSINWLDCCLNVTTPLADFGTSCQQFPSALRI